MVAFDRQKLANLAQKNKKNRNLETLTVNRTRYSTYNIQTIYKDSKGKVKKIDNNFINSIRKGTKTITLSGVEYLLQW
jgi:GMP synthase PP-ATPase subunit